MAVGIALHTLAAVIWVGGMFFAYLVLRPSAGALEPAIRLPLWQRVFSRFFPWVWLSIAVLLASGFSMIFMGLGGFGAVGTYVHAMTALGIVMMAIYAHLYFAPWKRFRRSSGGRRLAGGGEAPWADTPHCCRQSHPRPPYGDDRRERAFCRIASRRCRIHRLPGSEEPAAGPNRDRHSPTILSNCWLVYGF